MLVENEEEDEKEKGGGEAWRQESYCLMQLMEVAVSPVDGVEVFLVTDVDLVDSESRGSLTPNRCSSDLRFHFHHSRTHIDAVVDQECTYNLTAAVGDCSPLPLSLE